MSTAIALEKPAVLIVDDIDANLLVLEAFLGNLPCEVVRAKTGNEALTHLLKRPFAVILLDLHLPDMSGMEVAQYSRTNPMSATTPIIFVTADSSVSEDELRSLEAGPIDFLTKPLSPTLLLSRTRMALDCFATKNALNGAREAQRRVSKALSEARTILAELLDTPDAGDSVRQRLAALSDLLQDTGAFTA